MLAPTAQAPRGIEASEYVAVTVTGVHPEHATWAEPVRPYFRREGSGWKTVGLERRDRALPDTEDDLWP